MQAVANSILSHPELRHHLILLILFILLILLLLASSGQNARKNAKENEDFPGQKENNQGIPEKKSKDEEDQGMLGHDEPTSFSEPF